MSPFPYGDIAAARPPLRMDDVPPGPCVGCQNKAGEIGYKSERIGTLEREKAELLEQITDLTARANAAQPAPADFADLHARTHRLAREEAAARVALADCRNELQTALGQRDRALRTVANREALLAMTGRIAPAAAGWLSPQVAERLRSACDRNATAAVFAEILGSAE